jgi:predicted pyridoxine 5'-phosphate oxidase superfamily flavin-nucleotide-binding protein
VSTPRPHSTGPNPTGIAGSELLDLELAESSPVADEAYARSSHPNLAMLSTTSWPDLNGPIEATRGTPRSAEPENREELPGSRGEHLLQCAYDSGDRAQRFYDDQVLDHLNRPMMDFVRRMDMAFIASADARGECDSSLRAGSPGFIQVLDDKHVAYPEYRGNGVMASLGNISENPHIGILMVDFVQDLIGLHVNGKARIVEDADLRADYADLPSRFDRGRTPERWVVVEVEEAYIHCRKHIPQMIPIERGRDWGTDDAKRKGGDYFGAKGTPRPWHSRDSGETREYAPSTGRHRS